MQRDPRDTFEDCYIFATTNTLPVLTMHMCPDCVSRHRHYVGIRVWLRSDQSDLHQKVSDDGRPISVAVGDGARERDDVAIVERNVLVNDAALI